MTGIAREVPMLVRPFIRRSMLHKHGSTPDFAPRAVSKSAMTDVERRGRLVCSRTSLVCDAC
jgi:hypothetical protein